ncbi:fimbria/pilus outer membrane usher protein [Pseudomonas sp. GD03860]|uniref:fimbria/pilus outer membrane usher protein n=1 Tax=Pseudomonas TaxID=286 RepID=UPI0023641A49|nr:MULTISPECIES: fimbria/pilus outer membrane usher protein [Pseudomonas]MDD2060849.1 fimbria/pilus outer membrane usher protein [Pseudomonas putida]MDH0638331.1 fimbria/pilus outer membrane usher protein [Pseudomonas sp. GD03860]
MISFEPIKLVHASNATVQSTAFDHEVLRLRGIDPQLAQLFSQQVRFAPGRQYIDLNVNGHDKGAAQARFDTSGALCFDDALLRLAGIARPADWPTVVDEPKVPLAPDCRDLSEAYPQMQVELNPGQQRVRLIVPEPALERRPYSIDGYSQGGVAGLFNYDLFDTFNRYGGESSRYAAANTEIGLNADNWILRSRQVHSRTDGRIHSEMLDTFVQRSFVQRRSIFQAGEINLVNPVLNGAQIIGAQVTPEHGLLSQLDNASVQGIANSQARVEVHQNGALLYSTVVQPGPFSISNIPRLTSRSDLEVTVIETNGERRSFRVPASLAAAAPPRRGFSLGAGVVRSYSDEADEPVVLSLGQTGALGETSSLSSGLILAQGYQSVGATIDGALIPSLSGQLLAIGSQATTQDRQGLQLGGQLNWQLHDRWSSLIAGNHRSRGYRELLDSTYRDNDSAFSSYRDQLSASLRWASPAIGSFSLGYTQTTYYEHDSGQRLFLSWGDSYNGISVSASVEKSLGNTSSDNGDAVYLSVSLPLGSKGRVRSSVRHRDNDSTSSVNYQQQVSDSFGYRLGAEHRSGDSNNLASAGLSATPRYTQLDLNYAGDGRDANYNIGLRGGLAFHEAGITPSPYPIRDTFAILTVTDTPGVKASTPNGPVWTDLGGRAVIPALSAYGRSPIEVDNQSLPLNVNIEEGAAVLKASRGAVPRLTFNAWSVRRMLLTLTDGQGQPLPTGASVFDDRGRFISLVQPGGLVFIDSSEDISHLIVSDPHARECRVTLDATPDEPQRTYYTSVQRTCA